MRRKSDVSNKKKIVTLDFLLFFSFFLFPFLLKMNFKSGEMIFQEQLVDRCLYGSFNQFKEVLENNPGYDINFLVTNIKFPSYLSRSVLHIACSWNKVKQVELLLENPLIDVNNPPCRTPLHVACEKGFTTITRMLLNHPKINVRITNNDGYLAFDLACIHDKDESILHFLASGKDVSDVFIKSLKKKRIKTALENHPLNPEGSRYYHAVGLRYTDVTPSHLFVLIVFFCDGYVELPNTYQETSGRIRFFKIVRKLPMELQMIVCNRMERLDKKFIDSKLIDLGFRYLVTKYEIEKK
jgi:hypothetical protein